VRRTQRKKILYDDLEKDGYKYVDITFDTFKYIRDHKKSSSKAVKTKIGYKVCRWAQLPNNDKSIMPSILEELSPFCEGGETGIRYVGVCTYMDYRMFRTDSVLPALSTIAAHGEKFFVIPSKMAPM
jgi:hypothetical protein